ncbi:low-temperature-induced cysteine proteinase-like [Ananas comosus]|uniref:Low-temperature-induced cysteine proteinase-like n=2 Tax=Ananas comosus TaxID=4615 RepID=A0A6P5EF46_ANACO|nr:low-temperature-induced cysteine proteinase-like [Ananas comosus]CAD1832491.1 unnamed protein product [Ananas comosus var. bracteatus]
MFAAFSYMLENGGLARWENYPYKMRKGRYNGQLARQQAAQIDSFHIENYVIENRLRALIDKQPVVAQVLANRSFADYDGGFFAGYPAETTNHEVLITGYGTDPEHRDYWMIKNS